MKVGDRIRYARKHDGAKPERNGQVAVVMQTWILPQRGTANTIAMVEFPDGEKLPVFDDECEVVAAAETAVQIANKEADQNGAKTNADNEAG